MFLWYSRENPSISAMMFRKKECWGTREKVRREVNRGSMRNIKIGNAVTDGLWLMAGGALRWYQKMTTTFLIFWLTILLPYMRRCGTFETIGIFYMGRRQPYCQNLTFDPGLTRNENTNTNCPNESIYWARAQSRGTLCKPFYQIRIPQEPPARDHAMTLLAFSRLSHFTSFYFFLFSSFLLAIQCPQPKFSAKVRS